MNHDSFEIVERPTHYRRVNPSSVALRAALEETANTHKAIILTKKRAASIRGFYCHKESKLRLKTQSKDEHSCFAWVEPR